MMARFSDPFPSEELGFSSELGDVRLLEVFKSRELK